MGDKPPKCFVPECNNSVGVLFPKANEIKSVWLRALKLEHLQPDPKSFICLDHFGNNGQPGGGEHVGTKGGHKNIRPISPLPDQQNIHTIQKVQIQKEKSKLPVQNTYTNSLDLDADNVEENFENEDEFITIYSKFEKICRLCMVQSSNVTCCVFNKLDETYTIAQAIGICLYPLQVLPNDNLSHSICTKCIKSLKGFLKFYQTCVACDARQRELAQLKRNYSLNDTESELSDEYLHEERLSDYEDNKENQDDFRSDNTNGQIVRRESVESENIFSEKISTGSYIKRKYDKCEEELLNVLEGNDEVVLKKIDKPKFKGPIAPSVTEIRDAFYFDSVIDAYESQKQVDGEYAENIIIEMVDDEDTQDSLLVNTSKLPITIKRVENSSPTRKGEKRKLGDSNRSHCNAKRNTTVFQCENREEIVILPSGISVAKRDIYNSPLGQFEFELVNYVFNSQYVLAGGYLYEFGLVKDNVRRLHCIVNNCPGTGSHLRISRNEYAEVIEVTASHNHEIPDNLERKRQMFFHILYGKMRRDKHFNFKTLYDEFCKLDPCLIDILPLRGVIRQICKQGPPPAPPSLNTFAQFYDLIESDNFHKIHFTHDRILFYQDKFETDDGAKAVVFGNQEVIEDYSASKLMFVDSAFVIESKDFEYQLVTVLVWMDQCYYPILYALVNIKSQEIYKKIFNFLYNNLAPSLRPHEIITDYEANLYYALGETYVESSIGGSMFYFTQNIYKKICALNLARELELNANFRSIYNMLLMLPLLPVNTIVDGLRNIEVQARELDLKDLTDELFVHVHNEWICKVTPELFCVHRLENRINENIVAPFKKLRDLIMLAKKKPWKNQPSSIIITVEKLIDLEVFLRETFGTSAKKTFTKDLSSSQKKIILKAWNYIENHPIININQFFLKVLGYIKCMENQLWIWGFYRYGGSSQDILIDANNFSIINENNQELEYQEDGDTEMEQPHDRESQSEVIEEYYIDEGGDVQKIESRECTKYSSDEPETANQKSVKAVIDENGKIILQDPSQVVSSSLQTSNTLSYVYK